MRIAVVTETFLPFRGGSSKRYFEVFRRLSRMGFDVDLYTARLDGAWEVEEEVEGIRVVRSPRVYERFITDDGFRDIAQVLDFSLWVAKSLARGEYYLIEANHCPLFPAMASWLRSKIAHIPLTTTFHEVWHKEWHLYVPRQVYAYPGIILEKSLTWLPEVGIAVSKSTARRLETLLGLHKSKIAVIPNGIDLRLIEGVKNERDRWKVLYVGRLNPHKKVEWLIEAFRMVQQEYPRATLDIIGDGPMYGEYNDLVAKNHLEGVEFRRGLGDEELIRSMKGGWVYVLPSIREGQSITTLEAMASGTPQIVVDVDGNGAAELVADSASGIRVRPYVKELSEGIKKLLSDVDIWNKLSINGYKYALSLTWNNTAQEHKELYESLV